MDDEAESLVDIDEDNDEGSDPEQKFNETQERKEREKGGLKFERCGPNSKMISKSSMIK